MLLRGEGSLSWKLKTDDDRQGGLERVLRSARREEPSDVDIICIRAAVPLGRQHPGCTQARTSVKLASPFAVPGVQRPGRLVPL